MKRTILFAFLGMLGRGQIISTVAGGGLSFPGDNGPATGASIIGPSGVTLDSAGNVYFVEAGAFRVRKVDKSGVITTIAGDGNVGIGAVGDGGPATKARFLFNGTHEGIVVDPSGNIYMTDSSNYRVRKIDTNGNISTYAGNGSPLSGGDNGPATSAGMSRPAGLALDSTGNLYIAESTGAKVRKVDTHGVITTIAGTGALGFSGDGGKATSATFNSPIAVAVDGLGNIYIADQTAMRVRKVGTDGVINTVAGSGTNGFGGDGGQALQAKFSGILGITVDPAGAIYIIDGGNKRVRKVDTNGTITTVAGNGAFGTTGDGGAATSATFNTPNDVFLASDGTLHISDSAGGRVRKVSAGGGSTTPPPPVSGGKITTLAGGGPGSGSSGDGGQATQATMGNITGVAADGFGSVYIADPVFARVRKVAPDGTITTFAGNGSYGFSGDGGPATSASLLTTGLNTHEPIAVDGSGNLYIADIDNHRVRKVSNGIITTVAGNGQVGSEGDGGPATAASVRPSGIAVDSAGALYISDDIGHIRKVDSTGKITSIVSSGLNGPGAIAVDRTGNLYVLDRFNLKIRKVDPTGLMTTAAGTGAAGFSGDGGPATGATFSHLDGIAVDGAGNVYITDRDNNRVRRIDTNGIINTIAGNGNRGFGGDGGDSISATLFTPTDVAVDASGNVYIADSGDQRVRKVTGVASGSPSLSLVANAFGDTPLIAPNTWVELKGSNLAASGASRIWQGPDFAGNKLPTALDSVSVTVNGKPAYVYFISPSQVNILTPPDPMSGPVQVQLTNTGAKSNAMTVQSQAQSLSFFEFVSSDGHHYVYGRHSTDSGLIGPTSLYPGLTTPVKPGESIFIAATGFGSTDTPIVSGALTQSGSLPTPLPVIKIGGIQAQVSFAGLVSVGTYQINLVVPPGVPDGDLAITASYNGLTIQPNLLITVQH